MLEKLSSRAQSMLQKSKRLYESESLADVEKKIAAYITEPCEAFVNFEYHFGGYVIEAEDRWTLKLTPNDNFVANDILFVECAVHRVAQFGFHINESGAIYVTEYQDVVIPLASSIQIFIERMAMYHELKLKPSWYRLDAECDLEIAQLTNIQSIIEASDTYEKWWANQDRNLYITKHRMWDRDATPRISVFSHTENTLHSLVKQLEQNTFPYAIRKWPYNLTSS